VRLFEKRRDDENADAVEINSFLHDPGAERLHRALGERDWPTAREILTAADREHFMYYLGFAASAKGLQEWIPDVVRAEQRSTLPLLIYGARMIYWAWEARGEGKADTVSREQWDVWFQRLLLAENILSEVAARDPGCAEAWYHLVVLGRARQLPIEEHWRRFHRLTEIDPTHLFGHEQMLQNLMPKWSGSTEAMFDFARSRSAAFPGTDLPILIAQAHLEHRWSAGGNTYLRRTEVAGEIYAAAHNSLWHDSYRRSLFTPVVWSHFAYGLTTGRYFREACGIFDLIGDDWVRLNPWRSAERFVEMRAHARDEADDLTL
jgi:hypothetical protein